MLINSDVQRLYELTLTFCEPGPLSLYNGIVDIVAPNSWLRLKIIIFVKSCVILNTVRIKLIKTWNY